MLHFSFKSDLQALLKTSMHVSSDELTDSEKQLSEGGASAHELDKAKKKLEAEKEELATALEVQTNPA